VYDVGGNCTNQTKIVLQHPSYQYITSKTFTVHLRWATNATNATTYKGTTPRVQYIILANNSTSYYPPRSNNHYKKS
jgi:hypothetical protein